MRKTQPEVLRVMLKHPNMMVRDLVREILELQQELAGSPAAVSSPADACNAAAGRPVPTSAAYSVDEDGVPTDPYARIAYGWVLNSREHTEEQDIASLAELLRGIGNP
jgi:hypothetical protein